MSMQNLPTAQVYEKEFRYMPWGMLISEIERCVISGAPQNASVLDLLCGPGYLLDKLQKQRPDLRYKGVDFEKQFIEYARKLNPNIEFEVADVIEWNGRDKFDVILCTGGLHHLPFEYQETFIQKISNQLSPTGFAIVGDPYIDDFANEGERKLSGAKLGYEYLVATIKNGATKDVIEAAVVVLSNDILLVEYKSSIKKNEPIFRKYFASIEIHKTWPKQDSGYGDYYFVLKNN